MNSQLEELSLSDSSVGSNAKVHSLKDGNEDNQSVNSPSDFFDTFDIFYHSPDKSK